MPYKRNNDPIITDTKLTWCQRKTDNHILLMDSYPFCQCKKHHIKDLNIRQ